ncbi:hypothetical protein Tco_1578901 [Tanacetum coccineum]
MGIQTCEQWYQSQGIKQHSKSCPIIIQERRTERKKKEENMAAFLLQRSSKRNIFFKASKKLIIRSEASKKVITQSQASKKARRMTTLQQNQKSWKNQDLKKARNKKIEETKINRLGGNMLESIIH